MAFEPIRFLDGRDIACEAMPFGDLRLTVAGKTYEFVKALRTHPISAPTRLISLRGPDPDDGGKEKEIGIVRDLAELTPEARTLIDDALSRRYLVNVISRIVQLTEEFGYLLWEIETDRGVRSFTTPRWNHANVLEMGQDGEGRIVIDVFGNRAFIPNLSKLDDRSQRLFRRFIYW